MEEWNKMTDPEMDQVITWFIRIAIGIFVICLFYLFKTEVFGSKAKKVSKEDEEYLKEKYDE